MNKDLSVILVDFHSETETTKCLDSLSQINFIDLCHVIVAQPEAEVNKVEKHKIKPIMIKRQENLGYAWAVNLGISEAIEAGCKYIVVMNNDVTVKPDFIQPLVNQLENNEVGLVSPKIYFSPNREFHHEEYEAKERGKVIWYAGGIIDWKNIYAWHWGVNEVDHGQFEKTATTDFATGCCVAFRSELVDKIGLWDERYFLYLEDTDWSVRVKKAGLKVIMEPKSIIWHKNAGSTGGPGSRVHQYYQTRNRFLFASKYASVKIKAALYRQTVKLAIKGVRVEKQAAKDALLKKWGKAKYVSKP